MAKPTLTQGQTCSVIRALSALDKEDVYLNPQWIVRVAVEKNLKDALVVTTINGATILIESTIEDFLPLWTGSPRRTP